MCGFGRVDLGRVSGWVPLLLPTTNFQLPTTNHCQPPSPVAHGLHEDGAGAGEREPARLADLGTTRRFARAWRVLGFGGFWFSKFQACATGAWRMRHRWPRQRRGTAAHPPLTHAYARCSQNGRPASPRCTLPGRPPRPRVWKGCRTWGRGRQCRRLQQQQASSKQQRRQRDTGRRRRAPGSGFKVWGLGDSRCAVNRGAQTPKPHPENPRTPVLLVRGRADGVAVVAADEDNGRAQHRRKVEGGVRVALAAGAVAEVDHGHLRRVLHLQGGGQVRREGGRVKAGGGEGSVWLIGRRRLVGGCMFHGDLAGRLHNLVLHRANPVI